MWDSPVYKFEDEVSVKGKIVKNQFVINVTYSAPRNLPDPGKALIGVFKKITEGKNPKNVNILDFGAGKLRNTLWLLQKGFNVWAVEFEELAERLDDAKEKWHLASQYPNFKHLVFPKDFITFDKKFDLILLINVVNVMPIPKERFALLSLLREKIKENGILLWHQWRGLATGQDNYSEDNAFVDGYLMGQKNHTFYVEHNREQTFEMLTSAGFSFDKNINLSKIPGNSGYSFIFNPTHEVLVNKSLELQNLLRIKRDPNKVLDIPDPLDVLDLYVTELGMINLGLAEAHKYHRLASRIFYQIFGDQLNEPVIEQEINEGRGRIDITYKNKNKEGIFKNLKDLRNIPCPQINVECKNYSSELKNAEYDQLANRLSPHRGQLGFLLCRNKKNKKMVIGHCRDRYKGGKNDYIIVIDDVDLKELSGYRLNDDVTAINDFVENKILEIID